MNRRAPAAGALVVVAVLAACSPSSEPTADETLDTLAPESPAAQTEPPTEEPEAEPQPEPEPEPEQTEEPADPIEYSGSGDTTLDIEKPDPSGVGIATITHEGSSNFAVQTVETSDLLVNVIGVYNGRVLFDIAEADHTERLEITADGSWTVTTEPLAALTRFDNSLDGQGDDVVVYTGDGGVATITHDGESNFAIWLYYANGRDLLVNDIGSYSGQQLLDDAALLQITADGEWSMEVE
jgi:hypothetical protein